MKPSVRALAGACTSLAMGLPALAWSQAPYPSKPIRVIDSHESLMSPVERQRLPPTCGPHVHTSLRPYWQRL